MADGADLEQKLLLIIEEQLKNVGAALTHLESIKKAATDASKNLDKYSDATKAAAKSTERLQKIMFKLGQDTKKAVVGIGKGVGVVAGFGAAIMGAIGSTVAFNKAFVNLAVVAGNANQTLSGLRNSYQEIESQSQSMAISIQDAADVLADFASQSITASAALSDDLGSALTDLTNNIAAQLGPDRAKQMVKQFSQMFPDRAAFARIMSQYQFGSDEMFQAIEFVAPEALNQFRQLATVANNFKSITDSNVQAVTSWNQAWASLRAVGQNLADQLLAALGGEVKTLMDSLSGDVIPRIALALKDLVQYVVSTKDTWITGFQTIGETLMWVLERVMALPKPIMLVAAALAMPGVGPILRSVIGSIISIGTAAITSAIASGGLAGALTAASTAAKGLWASLGPIGIAIGLISAGIAALGAFEWLFGGDEADDTKGVNKEMENLNKSLEDQKKRMAELEQQRKDLAATPVVTPEHLTKWRQLQERVELLSKGVQGLKSQVESLQAILRFGGFNFDITGFGKAADFAGLLAKNLSDTIPIMKERAAMQMEAAKEDLRRAQQQMLQARTAEERKDALEAQLLAQKKIGEALQTAANAEALIGQITEARLAPLSLATDMTKQLVDLNKANLDISQALYGTPALGVQAMLNVVKQMQQQKQLLKAQLQQVNKIISEEGERPDLILKQRDLMLQIKRITADQLNQVKELRDGYLDAVQAQAFASGEFEKIIISQDKNLGMALDKGLVKANFLLGQVGEAANEARAMPYRFGAGGMGQLQQVGGGEFGPEQMAERVGSALKNIGDENMRAAVKESMDIVMGIHDQASQAYVEAADMQTGATYDLIDSQDGLRDAIDNLANQRSLAAATVGGAQGAGGELLAGEAARQAANATAARGAPAPYGVNQRTGDKLDSAADSLQRAAKANERAQREGRRYVPRRVAAPRGRVPEVTPEVTEAGPMPVLDTRGIYQDVMNKEEELLLNLKDALAEDAKEYVRFINRYNKAGTDTDARLAALEEIQGINPGARRKAEKAIHQLNDMYDDIGRWRFEAPEQPAVEAAVAATGAAPEVTGTIVEPKVETETPKEPIFTFKAPDVSKLVGEEQSQHLYNFIESNYMEPISRGFSEMNEATYQVIREQGKQAERIQAYADAQSRVLSEQEGGGTASYEAMRDQANALTAVQDGEKNLDKLMQERAESQAAFLGNMSKQDSAVVDVLSHRLVDARNREEEVRLSLQDIARRTGGTDTGEYKAAAKKIQDLSRETADEFTALTYAVYENAAKRMEEQTKVPLPDLAVEGGVYVSGEDLNRLGAPIKFNRGAELDLGALVKQYEAETKDIEEQLNKNMSEQNKLVEDNMFGGVGGLDKLERERRNLLNRLKTTGRSLDVFKKAYDRLAESGLPGNVVDDSVEEIDTLTAAFQKDAEARAKRMQAQARKELQEAQKTAATSWQQFAMAITTPIAGGLSFAFASPDLSGVETEIPTKIEPTDFDTLAIEASLPSRLPKMDLDIEALEKLQDEINGELHKIRDIEVELGGKLDKETKKFEDKLIGNLKAVIERIDFKRAEAVAKTPANVPGTPPGAKAAKTEVAVGDVELDKASVDQAISAYNAAKVFQDDMGRTWVEWKDDERKRHMSLAGDTIPPTKVDVPRIRLVGDAYAKMDEDLRSFSEWVDEEGRRWLNWTDKAGEKQKTLLKEIPKNLVDETVEIPAIKAKPEEPKEDVEIPAPQVKVQKTDTAPLAKGIEENAQDIVKKANDENKKAAEQAKKEADYPQLETRDALLNDALKEQEKYQQKSGQRIDELGFASDMVARGREDVQTPGALQGVSPRDAEALKKANEAAAKHKIEVREENAEKYDEQQSVKAANKALRDVQKRLHDAQAKQGELGQPGQPAGPKPQAQEGAEGPTQPTGGSKLTHGARYRSGAKVGGGGGGAGGMGTSGDRLIEAAKLMKKAAENLILIADDIDELSSEDRGVDYSTMTASDGGNALNTG